MCKQLVEPVYSGVAISPLAAMTHGDDAKVTVLCHPSGQLRADPSFFALAQCITSGKIETQGDAGAHLVDVLSAGAAAARKPERELSDGDPPPESVYRTARFFLWPDHRFTVLPAVCDR